MKSILKLFVFSLFGASLFMMGCNQGGGLADAKMETLADSMSYAVGVYLAQSAVPPKDMEALNADLMAHGLIDYAGDAAKLDENQVRSVITRYTTEQTNAQATLNKEKGEAFLAENKKKEGVMTTESGLQYKVIQEGSGATPTPEDKVRVHYTGKLLNGEVFDSSVQRGEPVEFQVTGVIPGWTEALQMMKVGAKWELFIPSNLAYRERGNPPIGPNETLHFEVELLDIVTDDSE
jgi:FKBP-type peptidyl-prolyl cis-trans isomerase